MSESAALWLLPVYQSRLWAGWRLGQTFFNVLEEFDPPLADEVRGGAVDPFYNDGLIPACGVLVKERWSHVY